MYAELHCHSYFSLLDGVSSPETLAKTAQELGLKALALTDHNSLAGAARFWVAAQQVGIDAIFGAEVTLQDETHLTLLAENQAGYADLCRLLTTARLQGVERGPDADPEHWPGKIEPRIDRELLAAHLNHLIVLTGCRQGPILRPLLAGDPQTASANLAWLREVCPKNQLYVELQHHALPDDDLALRHMLDLARQFELPVVATGNVHYATRETSPLRDVFTALRHRENLTAARQNGHLAMNSTYALACGASMARRFRQIPDALRNTLEIAERCQVSLDFSSQRLPSFPNPSNTQHNPGDASEFAYVYELCHNNLYKRYPQLNPLVLKQLAHELEIIEQAGLAGYFLTVWDIVRFAKEAGIRCQGRGSAANSIVAYLLEITSIDPLQHNLLFERFLSSDKFTTPDIDIDFAADRREEVIQYVYQRYGHEHTAMVCNVVTYRARSALRDLGKALDFPTTVIDRLVKALETRSPTAAAAQLEEMIDPESVDAGQRHPLARLAQLMRMIDGCPRHLSIHSGGMIITGPPLAECVPLEPATMPGRVVCQWDKDSIEDTGLIKIDLLGLRTLGLISEAVASIQTLEESSIDPDALPLDDPAIYAMLQRGDTIGAFQVESRAQQQMLPRLKPACFEDMIVEVAIVRPGPIQGGAVHPYLRRRAGAEPVSYLHPSVEPVLAETLGVLLFQEQAIRVAVTAAGFAPGEADMLRRAMSRSRSEEAMATMRERFLRGAQRCGIDAETAQQIFAQLAGFAGYGFCKSHAASFALIAYQTLYLKHYYPAHFYCALLNQQPMGFYSSEVVIGDARRHGVDLLPPDVQRSQWSYTLERIDNHRWALRSALSTVTGLGEPAWERIEAARNGGAFTDLRDFCVRTLLDRDVVSNLIRSGALDRLGERRRLLWKLGDIDYRPQELEVILPEIEVDLPKLAPLEEVTWEYELLGFSADGQVMQHYRQALREAGILSTWQVKDARAGRRVRVAGMVVVRQRPGTANGILFISLEDESGLLDIVVKPAVYQRLRDTIRGHPLLIFEGLVQKAGAAVSLLAAQAWTLGVLLR